MIFTLWIIFGVASGLAAIWLSRVLKSEGLVFGTSLIIAAFWYLGFGILSGHTLTILAPQIIGSVFFFFCGIFGFRYTLILSVGWFAHIVWDVSSPMFSNVSYMPHWTVPACLGFDTLSGCYLFARYKDMYPHQRSDGGLNTGK